MANCTRAAGHRTAGRSGPRQCLQAGALQHLLQRHRVGIAGAGLRHQFVHLQHRRQAGALQHHAQAEAAGALLRVATEQLDLAGIGAAQAQQHADRGTLAGTVAAQQCQHLASADLQVDALQGGMVAVAHLHLLQAGQRRGDRIHGRYR
jgi:hypothetical protein